MDGRRDTVTEEERGLGERWFEEVWNKGRRDAIPEMLAPDGVLHEGGLDSVGPDGFYPLFDRIQAAMEGIRTTVHETIAVGIPASGKTVYATGITIMRIADGKAVEGWQNWDMLGMMEQIQGTGRAATYVVFS